MKLILQKDVKNLGKAGDQALVKKGFARNFLIPKGLALPINKNRLKQWKHQQMLISAKKRKAVAERKVLIEKLSSIEIKLEKESLKDGKLFGSVTAYEISQTLEKFHNISVDKKDISLPVLKTTGEHNITIRLDSEHQTDIKIHIKGKTPKKREAKTEQQKTDSKGTTLSPQKKPDQTETSLTKTPQKKPDQTETPLAKTPQKKPDQTETPLAKTPQKNPIKLKHPWQKPLKKTRSN